MSDEISNFIQKLPKAELHVHIEGTLEPECLFKLAERNKVSLRWDSPEELRKSYNFRNLSDFLELYFKACETMQSEEDFFDATSEYLKRAAEQNILHTEMFLGVQNFIAMGVAPEEIFRGTLAAIDSSGVSAYLIPSVLRTRPPSEALQMLNKIEPWLSRIRGVGMGGAELNHPTAPFAEYFARCKKLGLKTSVHAGEETSYEYVKEAIEYINPDRIDHGLKAAESRELVEELAKKRIPLTLCPLSNIKLKNVKCAEELPILDFMKAGIVLTINSDDPAYFMGYLNENYELCAETFKLEKEQLCKLAKNSFRASFLPEGEKEKFMAEIDAYRLSAPNRQV